MMIESNRVKKAIILYKSISEPRFITIVISEKTKQPYKTTMKTKKKIFIMLALFAMTVAGATFCGTAQQKVNVKTLFDMLPEEALPEYVSLGELSRDEYICECDYENGYLELAGGNFAWQMCYWNLKDGRKLVATNDQTDFGSTIHIFFYENGQLIEDASYKLGGEQTYTLEDLVDISQLRPEVLEQAKAAFETGNYKLYFELPHKGTSLRLWLNVYSLMGEHYAIPEEALQKITIDWKNEEWVRQ
jgi:hypothetical protein